MTAACILGLSGATLISARGWPERFPPEVASVAGYYDYADRRDFREGTCFITSKYGSARYFDPKTGLHGAADRTNVLIIGDSHAAHLWAGFKSVFTSANVMQATVSGCKPLLHTTGKRYCTDLMRLVHDEFLPQHHIDTVYLSAAWGPEDAADLMATVADFSHYVGRVVVIGRIPGHNAPLPTLLARSLLDHDDRALVAAQTTDPFAIDRLFKTLVPATDYVSLTDALCPVGHCQVWVAPGVPLQFDTDHLTSEGSRVVATAIAKAVSTRSVAASRLGGLGPNGGDNGSTRE